MEGLKESPRLMIVSDLDNTMERDWEEYPASSHIFWLGPLSPCSSSNNIIKLLIGPSVVTDKDPGHFAFFILLQTASLFGSSNRRFLEVDHQDPENTSLLRFDALWEADHRHDSLLVFSTGRSPTLYKELRKEKPLLTPDITIMSVGTEITYGDKMIPDKVWEEWLNQRWDRAIVVEEASKFPQLKLQVETEQRPHKVSFYVEKDYASEVINILSTRLEERQLDVKIIYSGGLDLDILAQGAGKGQALAYLLKKFNSEGKLPLNTLVCGDSGNDAELFSVADVFGVMVSNAQEELLQWHAENAKDNPKVIHASERCAAGIIQAMQYFGLEPNVSPRDIIVESQTEPRYFSLGHEVVEFHLLCERWRRAEVEDLDVVYHRLKSAIDPNCSLVHPWGVEDNLFTAIDVLRQCYGDQKGKRFRVWIDRIRPLKIASDVWLVKFDKWELIEQERRCSLTTALLKAKTGTPNSFVWLHIHETWLHGCASNANLCCSL